MPHALKHRAQVHHPNPVELPPLRIVVVYDRIADLIRVNEIWSRLVVRFKDEIQIVSCAWNFTLLRDPYLRERAALHTAEADLIVFSAAGGTKPPDFIRRWIKAWLPWKKGRCAALVAVMDHEPPVRGNVPPTMYHYLQHTAEQGGMDFFCNTNQRQSLTGARAGFCNSDRAMGFARS
jgi:hypothetical protein